MSEIENAPARRKTRVMHGGQAGMNRWTTKVAVHVDGYRTTANGRAEAIELREGEDVLLLVSRGDASNFAAWVAGDAEAVCRRARKSWHYGGNHGLQQAVSEIEAAFGIAAQSQQSE